MGSIYGVITDSNKRNPRITERMKWKNSMWSTENSSHSFTKYPNAILATNATTASAGEGRYICIADGEVFNAFDFMDNLKQAGIESNHPSTADILIACYLSENNNIFTKVMGAFVFAVFDSKKNLLTLGRDMFGNKILFYAETSKGFMFSSNLASMADSDWPDKSIDEDGLLQYFAGGYICAPHTIYRGIRQLEPGHILTLSGKIIRRECFYSFQPLSWRYHDLADMSEDQVVNEFEELLAKSLLCRQANSHEAAVYLSGGRDTSMLCALLCKKLGISVTAFTMGLKGSRNDETHYAKCVAKHLGITDHRIHYLTADQFYDTLHRLPDIYGQPFGDISAIPTNVIAGLTAKSTKSVFCGDGPDFMFGNFDLTFLYCYYKLTPKWIRPRFAGLANVILKNFFPKWVTPNLNFPQLFSQPDFFWIFHKKFTAKTLEHILDQSVGPHSFPSHRFIEGRKNIPLRERFLLAEHLFYGMDNVLHKTTSAHNIHRLKLLRPMYDKALFEFVRFLPTHLKFRHGRGRFLQDKLLERYLPHNLIYRPKRGFIVDFIEFGEKRLKRLTDKYLSKKRLRDVELFNADIALNCVSQYFAGDRSLGPQMWALLNFQLCHERFFRRSSLEKETAQLVLRSRIQP